MYFETKLKELKRIKHENIFSRHVRLFGVETNITHSSPIEE